MNSVKATKSIIFLIFSVFLCLIVSGCGGGGGGSALISGPQSSDYAPFSLKLQMLGNTSEAPGYALPSTAAGEVGVTVTSLKDPARKVAKSASYGSGYITFENELLANDTYSVSVSARLKVSSGDTLEVWTGSVSSFMLYNEEHLVKEPSINTIYVGLQFSGYETIQIVPSKITFEPALPVSGLTPGASIPAFSVKMLDQYGFSILSTPSPVSVSLVNGTLAGTTSAHVSGGAASFSGLTASALLPDASGNVYLKASYGSAYGLSSPIPASIVDAPNTTVAGYIDYTLNAKVPSVDRAPAAGKACSIYVDGKLFETVTDSNGFFKLDVRVNSPASMAKVSAIGVSGAMESTDVLISPSKLYVALTSFSAPGSGRMLFKDVSPFAGIIPADTLKLQVDQKIVEIRNSSTGLLSISGRVVSTSATSAGLAGVTVSVSPGGQSGLTDASGFFKLTGPFTASSYTLTASKTGYDSDNNQITVTSNDYGFEYSGMNFYVAEKIIVKTLSSISISPAGTQLNAGAEFGLGSINAIANYSDGTSASIVPAWSLKSGGGTVSGAYYIAPASAGTTVLTAGYTEGGVTKTVDFTITVVAQVKPSSLLMSKDKDSALVNAVYDLSLIKAAVYYSDNSSKEVAVTWTAKNGGTLTTDKFTSDTEGIFLIEASYTEGADTLTSGISLVFTKSVTFEGLLLSKHTDTIEVGATYDLSLIKGYAVYSNMTTKEVAVAPWSLVDTGSGSISGNIYTAPLKTGIFPIVTSYTENGIMKESVLAMSIIDSRPAPTFTAQIISENTVKMIFSEEIDISALDRSKVFLNSTALTLSDILLKAPAESKSVYLTCAADFSVADQTDGIAAGAGKGLEFAAGCGIKSAVTGREAVTAAPVSLAKDTIPPSTPDSAILSKLMFSNGQGFILAVDAVKYIEMSQLEFYVGTDVPTSSTQPYASELLSAKGHAKSDIVISGFTPVSGGSLYYRFRDRAGNLSQWGSYGVIPAPPAGADLTWSNALRSVKISGAAVGSEGDRLFVYYTSSPTASIALKGSSANAPAGGFASGTSILISDTTIPSGSTVSYSIMSPLNVESQIVADGVVPAPPVEITSYLRLMHDLPNYAIGNISDTTSVTLLNDLRVTVESGSPATHTVLGRVAKGTIIGTGSTPSRGSYLTPESKSVDGLYEYSGLGGYLKLSYVIPGSTAADGNESEFVTSVPGNGVPGPSPNDYMSWNNTAMTVTITTGFGYYNDVIKVFEITSAGTVIYIGSTESAPQGGFAANSVLSVGGTPIASTSTIAFAVRSGDGNEGKITPKASGVVGGDL
jgi:hypothetical protein